MRRTHSLIPTLVLCACASEVPCRPWVPAHSSAAPAAGPASPSAALAPAPTPGDGTRVLEAADPSLALIGAPASPAARSPAIERAPEPAKANKADKADKAEAPPKPAPRKAEPSAKPAVAQTDAPSKISAPMLAEANKFYASRCVPCHGTQGRGDGPAGGALTPHPRNFTDRAWQRVVTDAHIEKTILQGGPSVGKSPLMPPHSDLNGKPELLAAMRTVVRGFAR